MFGLSKLQLIATVVGLAVLVGVPSVAAYRAGASSTLEEARKETQKRMDAQALAHREAMDRQRTIVDGYRELAGQNMKELLEKIDGIKVTHTTITRNIYQERQGNPEFYEQSLPEGGLKQWDESRNLLRRPQ